MTIIFLCPKPDAPSGGVWYCHRLAGLLVELGHPALVWTPKRFDVFWDANPVNPELVRSDVRVGEGDTLVVPEVLWPMAARDGVREILFLQNHVWLDPLVYRNAPGEIMVVSRYLANWAERMLGTKVIGKITPFLDDGVWTPPDSAHPKTRDRVLILARKNHYHAAMRVALEENGFTVEYVTESLTQRQLAEAFARCEFYVHLSHPEGFNIAAVEAMRSGTIVVGTTGGGGNEAQFHRETAMVVQDPENGQYFNADEFVRRILEAMLELRADDALRSRLWTTAFDWSLRYTVANTKNDLQQVFG